MGDHSLYEKVQKKFRSHASSVRIEWKELLNSFWRHLIYKKANRQNQFAATIHSTCRTCIIIRNIRLHITRRLQVSLVPSDEKAQWLVLDDL